jgi:cytochrome P450
VTECIAIDIRQKNGPNFEKSPIFIGAVNNMDGQTGISLAPNESHARQRRAMAHVFSNTALLQQEEIMQSHVDKLVGRLKKMIAENRPVNFSNWCK